MTTLRRWLVPACRMRDDTHVHGVLKKSGCLGGDPLFFDPASL
jgi:hypothetical protein